ncbi:MAG: DUF4258 domain-containing protein [Candidatus Micrarchaeota archaeon]
MRNKRMIMTKHAADRLLERKMPIAEVRAIVEKGVRLEDKVSGATLCVYKQKADKYYTLVLEEEEDRIIIITGYESSRWQVEQYHKVKKR